MYTGITHFLYKNKEKSIFMRQLININAGWSFLKDTKEIPATIPEDWEVVNG